MLHVSAWCTARKSSSLTRTLIGSYQYAHFSRSGGFCCVSGLGRCLHAEGSTQPSQPCHHWLTYWWPVQRLQLAGVHSYPTSAIP
jgi:hypothetical protein